MNALTAVVVIYTLFQSLKPYPVHGLSGLLFRPKFPGHQKRSIGYLYPNLSIAGLSPGKWFQDSYQDYPGSGHQRGPGPCIR